MKIWGRQDIKCLRCKNSSVKTFETAYDDNVGGNYCVRYFDRFCVKCGYWSGWIWLNNGQIKIPIEAKL